MLPVTRLNGLAIGDGGVGPVFSRLLAAWGDAVGVDIADQIKAWDAARNTSVKGDAPTPYRFAAPRK
jgi:branched-chain amino acid aminotransferase